MRDIDEEDLDTLAHARSFSVSSMAKTSSTASSGMEPTDQQDPLTIVQKVISHSSVRKNTEFRRSLGSNLVSSRVLFEHGQPRSSFIRRDSIKSSSSSSGCSSVSTPTNDQIVFEADFPVGTIKRKPSMAPKIPLTSTTRIIAKQSMTEDFRNSIVSLDTVQESNTTVGANTLGRNSMARMSLRRSHPEDEITLSKLSVDSGTLTKHIEKLQAVTYGAVDSCTKTLVNNISDDDELPPPPPEAFNSGGSTLSLDSLPPPPSSLHDQVSWPSTSSLNSLPPPPSEITQRLEDGKSLEVGSYLTCQDELKCPQNAPAVPPKPVYCKEYRSLEAENLVFCLHQDESSVTPLLSQKVEIPVGSCCGTQQQSIECPKSPEHGSLKRRVSFSYSPTERKLVVASSSSQSQLLNQDIISPNQINNTYQKPEPPRRSETTRLSGRFPATRRSSFSVMSCCGQNDQQRNVTTPHHFLRDLQRVMEKKWKVAQQLSADLTATPHQIMGFRDPCFLPPEFSSTLSHTPLHPPDSCHTDPCPKHHHHHLQQYPDGHQKQNVFAKKKLPPPPPKRSETTHLTRRQ
ncbi:uncharacterized protein LOC106476366 [Limulus polyphemus]|uniref:Uncharacterized protein LOC106476366 n=1 Tax=Limulus polyphemus TaxID=6850 RepID=A0ABM1C189_LIMPO|nr:uncharacterized protein LOC106476366 [Limulus polyphemus]XP_022235962.1 uncharacterized protein LOC106476366 [Limulus polyphemus]